MMAEEAGKMLVEFPGLWGLQFEISRVAMSVFGYSLYWYGLVIATGLFLCIYLANRHAETYGFKKDDLVDFLVFVVPMAIIMARLYYVAFQWEHYAWDFWEIFNIRGGGLAIYGAIVGGIATAYLFTKLRKLPMLKFFDFAVVYLPLGQAIGRWGNFFNQEAFGVNTSLPWGMKSAATEQTLTELRQSALETQAAGGDFPNMDMYLDLNPALPVHPTFLYESIWNFALFLFLLYLRKRKRFDGEVFAMYMAGYGLGRFFIEGLRTDSLMFGSVRISQFLAILFCGLFVAYIVIKRSAKRPGNEVGE